MRKAKFGAHCGVGSRSRTSTSPAGGHDARADEPERRDRLVELGVVDRAERLEDPGTVSRAPFTELRVVLRGRRARLGRQLELLGTSTP